jgi:hypothetical protein
VIKNVQFARNITLLLYGHHVPPVVSFYFQVKLSTEVVVFINQTRSSHSTCNGNSLVISAYRMTSAFNVEIVVHSHRSVVIGSTLVAGCARLY